MEHSAFAGGREVGRQARARHRRTFRRLLRRRTLAEQVLVCRRGVEKRYGGETALWPRGRSSRRRRRPCIRGGDVAGVGFAAGRSYRADVAAGGERAARAQFSVGPDSGLMHLSAAVGTPVVSLWGPTDPERTGPYGFDDLVVRGRAPCAPCYVKTCPIDRVCMETIKSGAVLAKIDAALARKGSVRGAAG